MDSITLKGKVNKGIRDFWSIMTKDQAPAALRGKTVTITITKVED